MSEVSEKEIVPWLRDSCATLVRETTEETIEDKGKLLWENADWETRG